MSSLVNRPNEGACGSMDQPKVETPIDENEIRITSQGRMRSYITYAMTLLQEKDSDEIVFKAMGRAIKNSNNCGVNQDCYFGFDVYIILCPLMPSDLWKWDYDGLLCTRGHLLPEEEAGVGRGRGRPRGPPGRGRGRGTRGRGRGFRSNGPVNATAA
ncbi:UNVERIFIED_CONTAM: hypothetical protein Sangu_1941500 [Sesamum angustifolium]|uniref:DNA/RNA-binding protein Alba-like domain-containing protein n=1 Tax=Sesamum angustifolium TaxID=2727405 RepID=A0AAW2LV42_9LAMI